MIIQRYTFSGVYMHNLKALPQVFCQMKSDMSFSCSQGQRNEKVTVFSAFSLFLNSLAFAHSQ